MTYPAAPGDPRASRVAARHSGAALMAHPAYPWLVFLVALAPLLSTPILPLIDFYNHVARLWILAHVGENATLAASYQPAWALLPNLGLDLVGSPLFFVLPPLLGAKLLIVVIFLLQFVGVVSLNRQLAGRLHPAVPPLAAILLYSYILTWGFGNFLLGTGLGLCGLAAWLALRERLWLAALAGIPIGVAILFCHGFAYALYGIALFGLEIGCWLDRPGRSGAGLARSLVAIGVQPILPAVIFLKTATIGAEGKGGSTLDSITQHLANHSLSLRLMAEMHHRLLTIVRVAEGPWLALDIASFCIIGGALLVAGWRRAVVVHRWMWPALAMMIVLCLITPPTLFGVGRISDRLPLFTAFLLVASLAAGRRNGGEEFLTAMMLAMLAVRTLALSAGWFDYGREFRNLKLVAAAAPPGAIVLETQPEALFERDRDGPRCAMYQPLLIVETGQIAPIFAVPSQQPIRLRGALKRLVDARDAAPDGVLGSGADYVLSCGYQRTPDPRYVEVARAGRLAMLRRR